MKVLIAEFDLYHSVGGGQTAYRRLIENNPDIEFHYLEFAESPRAKRPPNAHLIRHREVYRRDFANRPCDTHPPYWAYRNFVDAGNIAAAVAGQEYDVVEMADFRDFGSMLRPALRHHGVRFGRTVLSMHGRLSTSLAMDWGHTNGRHRLLDLREKTQFQVVDTRYGISREYLDEWRRIADIESHYLNPLRIVELPNPTRPAPSPEPPSLNFIGRTEKLKGPDIFLDLVWWLPRGLFSTANIIGPQSFTEQTHGSNVYLNRTRENRLRDVEIRPAMTRAELGELFASRSVTFLPSRYETLNLLALESLFSGCPTLIGSGAGVCRFLQESFPQIPFVSLDLGNVYNCVPDVCRVLEDYDRYRDGLVDALRRSRPEITGPSLAEIYESPPRADLDLRGQMDRWYEQLLRLYEKTSQSTIRRIKGRSKALAKALVPRGVRNKAVRAREATRLMSRSLGIRLRQAAIRGVFRGDALTGQQAIRGRTLVRHYLRQIHGAEQSDQDLDRKVEAAWSLAENFLVDRARVWAEIARLERVRGNELNAITCELRVMRCLGDDTLGVLPLVVSGLRKLGFAREARTAQAMFGPADTRHERCKALIDEASAGNHTNPDKEFERIDDRRTMAPRRVSIIVSLYDAADKLERFLGALQSQTLIKAGQAEIILIDSGSPADEYAVFRRFAQTLDVPILYARSAQRETIYGAWNRGIALARTPYLAFLGVDEMVVPEALEVLAGELDRDPALDWVVGNGLLSEVDRHGTWIRDLATFDRQGYKPTMSYLDICYLTYVGGLYRRSIHERFGYYDTSFAAAGDTEFKMRVLPRIKTKALPRTLGLFWNYNEERATQTPRAEIEDLSAWYLHRTPAGMEYAFAQRDPQEAVGLFRDCLRYRKSFRRHLSTDIELASSLASYLEDGAPGILAAEHVTAARRVQAAYRSLDWLPGLSRWTPTRQLMRVRRVAAAARTLQRRADGFEVDPAYRVFNDNRYEQHCHVWRSEIG